MHFSGSVPMEDRKSCLLQAHSPKRYSGRGFKYSLKTSVPQSRQRSALEVTQFCVRTEAR